MGVRRGIDRKKAGCRFLIDANLEGQVGVNKFKLYFIHFCQSLCIGYVMFGWRTRHVYWKDEIEYDHLEINKNNVINGILSIALVE